MRNIRIFDDGDDEHEDDSSISEFRLIGNEIVTIQQPLARI